MYKIKEEFNILDYPTIIDSDLTEKESKSLIKENTKKLKEKQKVLYAQDKYSILLIFQAMDTAGKDGVIRHVMSGVNPQGTLVKSFKQPTDEELSHDYLWRCHKNLPERGHIGIFNRSYYEEVTIVKVHDLIKNQFIPNEFISSNIWNERYEDINNFEKFLHRNGYIILKFFLHISKDEQRDRLIARIDDKSKNWKFSTGDVKERNFWDDYQIAYQDMINETSTNYAPWFVIPADNKWLARKAISDIIINKIDSLNLNYPTTDNKKILEEYRKILTNS
jgi:PPK2 family polyphosphate:nucleotide phosphotransferase